MKKVLALALLLLITTACGRSNRGPRNNFREREFTAGLVCDIAVESTSHFGDRTLELNDIAYITLPAEFGIYTLYCEYRPNPGTPWVQHGALPDNVGTTSWSFSAPGEYVFQAAAFDPSTGLECLSGIAEVYVLEPLLWDFGIELFTDASLSQDFEPLDNSFAAFFGMDVELRGEIPLGAFIDYELRDAVSGAIVEAWGTSFPEFRLSGFQLSPGLYSLYVEVDDGFEIVGHERTFEVFGRVRY